MDSPDESEKRSRFFGGLPERGIWTVLGLERSAFLATLLVSLALFLLIDGPLWQHLEDNHFRRIVLSYAFIPLAIAPSLWRTGHLRLGNWLLATIAIATIKLVLTALFTVVLGIVDSPAPWAGSR